MWQFYLHVLFKTYKGICSLFLDLKLQTDNIKGYYLLKLYFNFQLESVRLYISCISCSIFSKSSFRSFNKPVFMSNTQPCTIG